MQSNATIAEMTKAHRRHNVAARNSEREELYVVAALAALLSLAAFVFFYLRGDVLLWGDAVAHLNIARRLFDSIRPGTDQLGSVWLPLPHLLIAPFVVNDWLWRTGIGGSIPSMAAYVLGVAGVFRLVRARASRAGAWLAAAIFALNPSLVYMQSTAMTESIFLAALVWSVVYFDDFLRGLGDEAAPLPAWRALERCGLCLAAAIFTRYDGWIFAFVVGVCAVLAALRWILHRSDASERRRLLRSTASFLLLLALCPALWLAHNYKINRRPLDWLNGPYSAKAIERRTARPGEPPYPGKDHPVVAAQYFLKCARMNTGEGGCEKWLIALATAGVLIALARPRRFGALLLLWIPLPFYAYAIAYGSVPIFLPEWWPFSYYNVRYGLELLPAIAVFAGLLPWAVSRVPLSTLRGRRVTAAATVALFAAVILAYNSSAACASRLSRVRDFGHRWMIPICYREAWVNSRGRLAMESQLAEVLSELPPRATILMYTSDHVGALQDAGIHFRRVTSESAYFHWDAALSAPYAGADYIVAIDGDPVAQAVGINPRGLTTLAILHSMGEPPVTIYRGSLP
jgi:Dolichyl-phosphate-mannose-protein mannosyltransferase